MITLDYADKRPLYEQIKDKLRGLIISGVLQGNDRIPSVRELAWELSINPNTIQKAYRELESEGYVYSVAAKGNYVCPREDSERARDDRKGNLYETVEKAVSELRFLGESKNDIVSKISELFD